MKYQIWNTVVQRTYNSARIYYICFVSLPRFGAWWRYYDVIVWLPWRPAEIPFPACTVWLWKPQNNILIYKSLPRIPPIVSLDQISGLYDVTNFKRIPYYSFGSFHPGTVYILLCARIAYIFTWLGILFYITFTSFHNRARSRHRRQSNNMYLPINIQQ